MVYGLDYKKGNIVIDGIIIAIAMAVFGIILIFGLQIFTDLNTEIQADPDLSTGAKEASADLHGKYPAVTDSLWVLAYILFIAFSVVSVFLLDTHPIFFVFSVFLLIGLFIVSILLANTFDDIMTDPSIAVYANQYTYMGWMMRHLLEITIGHAFLVVVALFFKFKS